MEEKENKRKMVEANLRSVTQSCKGGVPVHRLEKDYRDLLGTRIPVKELGFHTLEAMLKDMNDVIKLVRNETGSYSVMAVADVTTAHIASLVARQKPAKKRIPARPRYMRGSSRMSNFRQPFSNYEKNRFQPTAPAKVHNVTRSVNATFKPASSSRTAPPLVRTVIQKPINHQSPTFIKPEPVKVERPKAAVPAHPKIERSQSISSLPKRDPPMRSGSYEVPPRFLRQQLPTEFIRKCSIDESSSDARSSPVVGDSYAHAAYIPMPRQGFSESGDHQPRIPSPKPKVKAADRQKKRVVLPPPPLPKLLHQLPPKEFIEEYARMHNLETSYTVVPYGQKVKSFACKLKLGGKLYNSFPEEVRTPEEAEELAAAKATQAISEEEAKPKYAETSINTPEEIFAFGQRTVEIIADTQCGAWGPAIPKLYEEKYLESLPSNWLDILRENPPSNIDIEVSKNPLVKEGTCILRIIKNSGGVTPTSGSVKSESLSVEELKNNSILPHGAANIYFHNLPPLALPLEEQWEVYVTYVSTTMNIAVRLIDQHELFTAMSEDMKAFYTENLLPVYKAHVSKLYAVRQVGEDDDVYFRVRVDTINSETNEVNCYFIDVGDKMDVNVAELQELHNRFDQLPPQAIQMCLAGLEDYVDLTQFDNLDFFLLGKTVIATIKNRYEKPISAVFYDTSGATDVNLNEKLKEITFEESMASNILPEEGNICNAYLTHVTAIGEVFLRLTHPVQSLLEVELEKSFSLFEDAPAISPSELVLGKVYVCKYTDNCWYRTVYWPSSENTNEEIEMFYCDFGNTSPVHISNIKNLSHLSKILASLPCQAIPCKLKDIPPKNMYCTDQVLSKLYELAPELEELIVKVEKSGTETSPVEVTLFRRNDDNEIISINQTLQFCNGLFSLPSEMNGTISPFDHEKPSTLAIHSPTMNIPDLADDFSTKFVASNSLTSPPVLWAPTPEAPTDPIELADDFPPPPVIPDVETFFDVYITFVASPSNFAVQPLKYAEELNTLLEEMRCFYHVEDNVCEMHHCLLKLEHYYAALYKDGIWYRVKVKAIDEGEPVMVTVHFIDFGDFDTISLSNLQPLYRQFKTLPCQAIKASLYGVKPEYGDWLAEQCVKAKEIMNERQFVSHVKEKVRSERGDFGDVTLSVMLIDTSSPNKDVYVHDVLIEKGLACPAT